MLSSDVLEKQFGPTHVEVMRHDTATRIIRTLTEADQVLEVSWVVFEPAGVQSFTGVHEEMGRGASMGKAFESAGVKFTRKNERSRRLLLPFFNEEHFDCEGRATASEVDVVAGDERIPYASILEIYSPAVRWPVPVLFGRRPNKRQLAERVQWFELILKHSG